jgi:predicted ribosomally synthesized peptide with nif11-like leader
MNRPEDKTLRVLVLEPYYGGSHKSFLAGLCRNLPFTFDLMTLPARKWKWRMRLSAPFYAQELHKSGRRYDRILCSTFVDVAAFRGLAPSWVREVPLLTYFHENQFAYPTQFVDERDFHFALTNLTTALSSDRIAFNSLYNLASFVEGIEETLKHSYDLKLEDAIEEIKKKSRVLPPGIDFSFIDTAEKKNRAGPPVILWNHRWEHDKDPDSFFEALFGLDRGGIDFRLVVLGESFKSHPEIFDEAKKRLSDKVLQFGYVRSRKDYARWLKQGSLVVSTARHEFFGIAVLEAVRAGCRPLLPRRLSYPELFPEDFLYNEDDLLDRLKEAVRKQGLSHRASVRLTKPVSWKELAPAYESWIKKEQNMSIESAKAFVERMKTDGEFRNRVAEAESPEVRERILKYEGFDFTDEELDSLRNTVKTSLES